MGMTMVRILEDEGTDMAVTMADDGEDPVDVGASAVADRWATGMDSSDGTGEPGSYTVHVDGRAVARVEHDPRNGRYGYRVTRIGA